MRWNTHADRLLAQIVYRLHAGPAPRPARRRYGRHGGRRHHARRGYRAGPRRTDDGARGEDDGRDRAGVERGEIWKNPS